MKPWILTVGTLLLPALPAAAQYEVAWWTVDGGGVTNATGGTYTLSGTVGQPDAGGPYVGASYALHSGFWGVVAGPAGGVVADLAITKSDGMGTVAPGAPVMYTIVATNAGPGESPATVIDTLPGALVGASWTCVATAGSACTAGPVSGGINDNGFLSVGGTLTYTLSATLSPSAIGALANTAIVSVPAGFIDPNLGNNSATDTDVIGAGQPNVRGEITHGLRLRADLAALPGPSADEDRYRINQKPYSSYEVVIDETSGDIGLGAGPALERVADDGSTVLQSSVAAGVGPARSLRWENSTSTAVNGQIVRVKSTSCGTDCDGNDAYRIRAYETTSAVPRFNNTSTQVTVLLLQNPGISTITGHLYFWNPAGTLLAISSFNLGAHQLLVLNTSGVAGLTGQSGTITLSHDGRYGDLVGKTVALEPATGFSFDSPLERKAR